MRILMLIAVSFLLWTMYNPLLLLADDESKVVPNYSRHSFQVLTKDRIKIRGDLFEAANKDVIIYCHRLIGSGRGNAVVKLVNQFITRYDIVSFNFRGHGYSERLSSTGGDEIIDLHAVMAFLKVRGYDNVVVIGTGMGAGVAIRFAAIFENVDAIVAISPSGLSPDLQPFFIKIASDVTLNTDFGRVPLRIILNTRLGDRYSSGYPVDLIEYLPDLPILMMNSRKDRFLNLNKLREKVEKFITKKDFMVYPGRNHAEQLFTEEALSDMSAWLDSVMQDNNAQSGNIDNGKSNVYPAEYSSLIFSGDIPLPKSILADAYHNSNSSDKLDIGMLQSRLEQTLAFHGYTHSKVSINTFASENTITISIPKMDSLLIKGNRWIREDYIRSILKVNGGYFNYYEIDAAARKLALEPAIKSVAPKVVRGENGNLHVTLNVSEERPYRAFVSTKLTDFDQFYGAGFTWNEFNPSGFQLIGSAKYGISHNDLLTNFKITKSLKRDIFWINARVYDDIKSRDDLEYVYTRQEVQEKAVEVSVRLRFSSNVSISTGLFDKRVKSPEIISDFPVEEGKGVGNFWKLDIGGRLPTQGISRFKWRHTLFIQNVGIFDTGEFDFNIYQFNLTGDLKISKNHQSVTSLHYGWISGEPPPQDNFSLGGMTTLPGFDDDKLIDTRMFRLSQALYISVKNWVDDTSILSPLRFIFTTHTGTVWGNTEKFDANELHTDIGFEIDYMEVLRLGIAGPVGRFSDTSPRIYIGWGLHVF